MGTDQLVNRQVEHVVLDGEVRESSVDFELLLVVHNNHLGTEVALQVVNLGFGGAITADVDESDLTLALGKSGLNLGSVLLRLLVGVLKFGSGVLTDLLGLVLLLVAFLNSLLVSLAVDGEGRKTEFLAHESEEITNGLVLPVAEHVGELAATITVSSDLSADSGFDLFKGYVTLERLFFGTHRFLQIVGNIGHADDLGTDHVAELSTNHFLATVGATSDHAPCSLIAEVVLEG